MLVLKSLTVVGMKDTWYLLFTWWEYHSDYVDNSMIHH